ncbi:MAG TPA: response regulator [Polyangiaceae bacterium]
MTAPANDDGAPAAGERARGKLLVVDDEQQLRRLLARSLSRAGYEVSEAKDGREALALARQTRFDLVISDVHMPELTGLELLQALHDYDPDLPVALLSGSFDDSALQRARALGAVACLGKPVAFQDLHSIAARAIPSAARR